MQKEKNLYIKACYTFFYEFLSNFKGTKLALFVTYLYLCNSDTLCSFAFVNGSVLYCTMK